MENPTIEKMTEFIDLAKDVMKLFSIMNPSDDTDHDIIYNMVFSENLGDKIDNLTYLDYFQHDDDTAYYRVHNFASAARDRAEQYQRIINAFVMAD